MNCLFSTRSMLHDSLFSSPCNFCNLKNCKLCFCKIQDLFFHSISHFRPNSPFINVTNRDSSICVWINFPKFSNKGRQSAYPIYWIFCDVSRYIHLRPLLLPQMQTPKIFNLFSKASSILQLCRGPKIFDRIKSIYYSRIHPSG